jgi:phenylalanyl-tRNA synthetase alpha chain
VRVEVLGRKGSLAQISKDMGKLAPEERARIGKLLNAAKQKLEAASNPASAVRCRPASPPRRRVARSHAARARPANGPSAPHHADSTEIEDLFVSLGFAVLDGPEVEDEYHNFDALNIPADHPARDMQDTFWLMAATCCAPTLRRCRCAAWSASARRCA